MLLKNTPFWCKWLRWSHTHILLLFEKKYVCAKKYFYFLFIFFAGTGSNAQNEYLPDRPIGYGAFGVVWSVTDPRDGKRVALKKLPNVFQSLVSSKRVFRELKMMRFFKHENVLSCLDILQVPNYFCIILNSV